MATITTAKASVGVQPRTSINREITVSETHTLTVAQNVTANIIEMVKLPLGATVLDVIYSSVTLAASAMLITVGDAVDPDRYIESSSISVLGGVASMDNELGHLFVVLTTTPLVNVTIATQGGTPAEGDLKVSVTYTMDP